jgi:hypothetical protein
VGVQALLDTGDKAGTLCGQRLWSKTVDIFMPEVYYQACP